MRINLRIWIMAMTLATMSLRVLGFSAVEPEGLFYYSFGKKIFIEEFPDRFMLKKGPEMSKEQLETKVSTYLEKAEFDWFNDDICTVLANEGRVDDALNHFIDDDMIVSARHVYCTSVDKDYYDKHKGKEPLAIGLIDQIVLCFKDGMSQSTKKEIKKEFGLMDYDDNGFSELCVVSKDVDLLSVANRLFETGYFKYAYPEFICRITFADDLAFYPNDPYFQYQVTLHNTGQTFNGHSGYADADIDAPEAWALTMGSEDIVVAVIDQGVTSDHPDLPNTRQVRLNGSNFGSGNVNDPSPTGNNNHGNACAGVIAATANNGEGIAGIAPKCKIMPIRTDNTTCCYKMSRAIYFAVENGAKIISNSWGYSTRNNISDEIVCAIQYAVNHGCLVLFATGNNARYNNNPLDSGFVEFPANRRINGMLAVGASDRYDYQAYYSPTDTCVDIVAPSHRAYNHQITGENFDMWSLDIPGNNGYNPCPSDQDFEAIDTGTTLPGSGTNYLSYTGHFGGTSHACPVVAGVAALVLSVNPDLTPQEVCRILKNTADTVGGYNYVNHRCDEMGYGRVNANKAVWATCDTTVVANQYFDHSTIITGCDIVLENDTVGWHEDLRVRAKNSTTINGFFYIGDGGILEIIPYR